MNLEDRKNNIVNGGGAEAVKKQHDGGKYTARERLAMLLDKDSFVETDMLVSHHESNFGMENKFLPGDGVVTGLGKINGRPVAVFAQDFTVMGGTLGIAHARKITKIMKMAYQMRMPIIGLNDSGGARIQEGVDSQAGYGEIFYLNSLLSGVVPQISLILGPCAGGAAYSPALTDFVFVVDGISKMFVTGPNVIKTVLGEDVTQEELGGAKTLSQISGNSHFYSLSEDECFEQVRTLMSYLPQSCFDSLIVKDPFPAPKVDYSVLIPADTTLPYDVRDVIKSVCDAGEFFEVQQLYAMNMVVGFGRIEGRVVGYVANQPMYLAGVLDCDAADKASRFISVCDSYSIPIVTFEDMPGCMPGVDQEHSGVIRHGGRLIYAYSNATVPKITVILRKAYGGGYVAMNSRLIGADFVLAWPFSEIAVMGAGGAVNMIYRKELKSVENPELFRQEKIEQYKEKYANPYDAASKGYVDFVIQPNETREYIVKLLLQCGSKKVSLPEKKHGIYPS